MRRFIVGVAVAIASTPEVASAQEPLLEVYGTLYPFTEYVGTSGATAPGYANGASQVGAGAYSGNNDRSRLRMTAGTSNLGFRGSLNLVNDKLRLIWQVENAVPIDGNGPPNTFASRNSHVGFGSPWGSLIFGIWDTPYKWELATTLNPLRAGYVTDFTPIINTPGFGVGALNTVSGYAPPTGAPMMMTASASNAAFHRREANSIQYWSPKVAGFSARLNYTINEGKNAAISPYLVSGSVGWEGVGLKVRYAVDYHHDYFGMASIGGALPAPNGVTTSSDMGHEVIAQYTLDVNPDFRTRIAATAELLSYKSSDTTVGDIDRFSRPAFYAILEQSLYKSHAWLAYGQALDGSCKRVGGGACSTAGLGAKYVTIGYLYALTEKTNIHVIGYRVFNDVSSQHVTFPALGPMAAGADQMGVGIGIIHSFGVPIFESQPAATPVEKK
jgi:predicted porin